MLGKFKIKCMRKRATSFRHNLGWQTSHLKLVRSNHTFKLMEELPYFHYGLSVCQLQTQFSQLKMNYLGNLLYLGRQEGSLELESRRDDYLIVWPRNHNALLMGLLRNHVIEKQGCKRSEIIDISWMFPMMVLSSVCGILLLAMLEIKAVLHFKGNA